MTDGRISNQPGCTCKMAYSNAREHSRQTTTTFWGEIIGPTLPRKNPWSKSSTSSESAVVTEDSELRVIILAESFTCTSTSTTHFYTVTAIAKDDHCSAILRSLVIMSLKCKKMTDGKSAIRSARLYMLPLDYKYVIAWVRMRAFGTNRMPVDKRWQMTDGRISNQPGCTCKMAYSNAREHSRQTTTTTGWGEIIGPTMPRKK
jgi:hypothetical protein